jgi:tetratricopeptide (TPR) repeat protein/CheY-like chemotaxis protein
MPYASIAQVIHESIRELGMEFATSLVLTSVLADLVKFAPALKQSFPHMRPNQPLDPQSEQQRIFDSFVSFFEAISQARQAPFLLVLEDMHWSDIDSIHLVRYLVHRSQRARLRIMVLITYRDTEISLDASTLLQEIATESGKKRGVEHVHLTRMERKHTRELLAHLLSGPGEIDETLVDAVQSETEGNPFFIEEVCWSLLEEKHSFEYGMIRMPATISEVILARIRRLPATCQKILWQAAFLGQKFSFDTLRGLTRLNEEKLIAELGYAKRAQILLEEEISGDIKLTFAHSLIPFALRESASGLRRRHAHQRVAAFLESNAPNDLAGLAFHYAASGNPLKAITYAQQAARQAMSVFAFEIALQHIRSISNSLDLEEILSQVALRISILEDLGDIYRAMGKAGDAVTAYQQALTIWHGSIEKDRWTAIRLNRKLSETVLNINQYAEFQHLAPFLNACLEEGLLLVKTQPAHPETVRLLVSRARFTWYMRSHVNWEEAEKFARQAVVMAQKLNGPIVLSTALEALASVYGLKGLHRERVDVCRHRLMLSYEPDFNDLRERTNILLQIGMALYDVGEYHSALGYLVEAENLGYQIRDIPKQADALVRQGQCWYRLDRWDEVLALESKIKALEDHFTFRRMGVLTCSYFALLASILYLRGKRILANQVKDKAWDIMLAIGGPEQMWVRNQHF